MLVFRDNIISTFICLKTKKFLLISSLTLLLVCIPQINLPSFPKSTITSKFIVFIYFCTSLFCLSVFWILKSKVTKLSLSKVDITLATLFIYIVCNRYFFQSEYSFSIRFLELLGLSFLYVIFRTLNIKLFYFLLLGIIVSGVFQSIYGNLQLLGYFPSNHSVFILTGSFFNPGPYAGFLVSVFPIALGVYLFRENVISHVKLNIKNKSFLLINTFIEHAVKYISVIGVISISLVIPATQSRASWLAAILSSIFLLELRYKTLKKLFNLLSKLKKVVLAIFILLIVGMSLFGVYHLKKGSSDGRLFIWKTSTEIIKDNPFFGVGFDRFKAHYMNYQANYFSKNEEASAALVADNTYYAFNEFMQFTSENGILGFIILMSILYFITKILITKENFYLGKLLGISLLSIGVFAFFSYPMEILPIKLVMCFLLAALAKLDENIIKPLQTFKIKIRAKRTLKILIKGAVLLAIIFSFKYLNKLNSGLKNWELALNSYQYGDYERAIQKYKDAYPELRNNGEFLMNYGKALSIYKQDKKAVEILERAKIHLNTTIIETALGNAYNSIEHYKEAEIVYKHAADMIPSRFYPLYLLAKLYDKSGQKEKAMSMAEIILKKEIKVPSTAITEIKHEMNNLMIKLNMK